MKHENCKDCLVYDELLDGILTPCDDERAWKKHYCLSYQEGIPKDIWKGKQLCPYLLEENDK